MPNYLVLACLLAAVFVPDPLCAGDWPQFLGPTRNGVYPSEDLDMKWPTNGPAVLWQKRVGHGFSGPAVRAGKLILFHRLNDKEIVDCLEALSGKAVWRFEYPTSYQDEFGFDDGPRATPTISEDCAYTFGAQGMLHCLKLSDGQKLWSVDVQRDYQAPNGFFGLACSPLVKDDLVLVNIGGANGAGIVAFDKRNGHLRWKASDDEAGYSSPVSATLEGKDCVLFFTRNGLVATDVSHGQVEFQYSWHSRNRMSVNAATPLVLGDTIFLSACYGTGAALLRWHDHQLEKVWSGDELMSNHYATSVERNGFLYGIHGRADPGYSPRPKLRCVDIRGRKVCWEAEGIGSATLTLAGDRLLILTEKGELIQAMASPEAFQVNSRAQVLASQVRAFPAVAGGCFYARSQDQLVCLDLRKSN